MAGRWIGSYYFETLSHSKFELEVRIDSLAKN